MARYTHDLMGEDEGALAWGIKGAGLRATDKSLLDALAEQDGLYALVEREGARENRVLIGAIVQTIDASLSAEDLLTAIDAPQIRIVSTSVTENGYCLDRATKTLNFESPDIIADLGAPRTPRTAPGILLEAYRRRYVAGAGAFTSLCCDNIQHNGDVLKAAILALAGRQDRGLARWIDHYACFPNSMVDRITPVPTKDEIDALRVETGLDDRASLHSEIFRQWVIEDKFSAGRPDWDKVGAQFVDNVAPYEFMKLRLLNGSHLAIAGLGQLCGYALISETIEDPFIRLYMAALMDKETGPTLAPVPGVDLAHYKRSLIDRFANRAIKDTTQRVNSDAPINVLIDPMRDRLLRGHSIDLLALGLAAWCRRVSGRADDGKPIAVAHPMSDLLARRAREGGADPAAVLSITELFGALGRDDRVLAATRRWLTLIYQQGMRATLIAGAAEGAFAR
ncbi:MAG: mannitol dehydrogenase family protein [Hyphomonadaceae bacterium JAD_PAG50586_4]|nr:MAG: mannitol dehydrogenase family protein [Hyphomonadaceae bacterium JAD_PAG50586_4]